MISRQCRKGPHVWAKADIKNNINSCQPMTFDKRKSEKKILDSSSELVKLKPKNAEAVMFACLFCY